MFINETAKNEIAAASEQLKQVPKENRDFVAGVLAGLARAEEKRRETESSAA